MTALFGIFLAVLAVSFLCSLLEGVFLSITPAFISLEKKENPRTGRLMERLRDHIDRPIAAILSLNTIVNTAGSASIGAMVSEQYGDTVLTIASVVLTFSILFLSEILPKIVGALYWKNLATFATYTIQVIIFLLYPIVWVAVHMGRLFKRPDVSLVTRAEVMATAELGMHEGELHHKENTIIKNLLMLDNIYVSDIMTPRSVIFALESQLTVEEAHTKYRPIRFSRIPVYEGSLDNIIGMTMRYKIHEALSSDQVSVTIKELTTPLSSVSERMTVAAMIDYFVKKKEHMALAVDEYGVVTGLVSLEDGIETLLGVEIVDELDHASDMRQFALEQWQMRKNQFRKS